MSALEEREYYTVEEYLELDRQSEVPLEYVDGEIYAMSGGSDAHGGINFNLTGLLYTHLCGGPCEGYSGNMKVRVESVNVYYYPDQVVTCDERDREIDGVKRHSCLIMEVLSPTTEAIDQGRKFRHYRQIPELQEYVVLYQDVPGVECFRRREDGDWVLKEYRQGDVVHLESIKMDLPLQSIYEGVKFSSPNAAATGPSPDAGALP